MKEESEKVGLKLNIQKTKIVASSPITLWQIDGETVETVDDFIFWGSQISADGDCSHGIKRRLLLGRKAMTNLDSILKSRDITLPTKVRLVKIIVFSDMCPVVELLDHFIALFFSYLSNFHSGSSIFPYWPHSGCSSLHSHLQGRRAMSFSNIKAHR